MKVRNKNIIYSVAFSMILVVTLAGCGGEQDEKQIKSVEKTTAAATALSAEQQKMVTKAVTVANAIAIAPETMTAVLATNHITAEEYKSLIYKISADPVLSRAYEAARKK